jgi:hypothetical protein
MLHTEHRAQARLSPNGLILQCDFFKTVEAFPDVFGFTEKKHSLAYGRTEYAFSVSCFLRPHLLRNPNTFTFVFSWHR